MWLSLLVKRSSVSGCYAGSGPSAELREFLRSAKSVFELMSNCTKLNSELSKTCPITHRMTDRPLTSPQLPPNPTFPRRVIGHSVTGDRRQSVAT